MKYKILNLIDFEKVNILLEGFNKSTGFVTAILDLDGNVLSQSGWRQICTNFHRVHPETAKRCTESDTILARQMKASEKYHSYKCRNGLIDVAVPITIKGEHVANLFSGQFFFEKPDRGFFENQAKKYKFNNTEYLNALDKVPVVSEEKVKIAMDFLLNMTQIISDMTIQKLEQVELNEALKTSEERWQFAVEGNGDGLWDWNFQTNEVFFSKQWKQMLGFEDHEIPDKFEEWDKRVHPDDKVRAYEDIKYHTDGSTNIYTNEHRLLCKDGTYKWILTRGKTISRTDDNKPLRIIGIHTNITERKLDEDALRESEEKFMNVFEQSPLAIQTYDMDGKLVNVNQKTLDLFGLSDVKYVLGFNLWEDPNLSPDNRDALKKGEPVSISASFDFDSVQGVIQFPSKRKGIIFLDMYVAPLMRGNNITEYLVQIVEITNQKEYEEELKKHHEQLEELVNERTKNLDEKNEELQRMNKVFIGRELKMVELKEEIKKLKNEA